MSSAGTSFHRATPTKNRIDLFSHNPDDASLVLGKRFLSTHGTIERDSLSGPDNRSS